MSLPLFFPDSCPHRVRFGPFEPDLETGELRKNGRKLRLQEQPFQILVALLEQRGGLVTREALRNRLWSSETFGDFDNGLNTAVSKLRDVLGDSAEEHRYIETLARRGYRFAAAIEQTPGMIERGELEIQKSRVEPDIVIVQITGRMTFGPECQKVEWLIAHLLAEMEKKVILDISSVTRMDSTGVGVVVGFNKLIKAGCELRVVVPQNRVEELLRITMVDRILALYPTLSAALEGFADERTLGRLKRLK